MSSEDEDLEELERTVLSLCQDDDTVAEVKNESNFFNFSPSKLAGIQLPVLTETPVKKKIGSPLNISKLSPIKTDTFNSNNAPSFSPFTPATLRCTRKKISHKEKFCSTPCTYKAASAKQLKLNKTVPTISEDPDESFDSLLQSVYQLCEGKTSEQLMTNSASVSQINLDTIFQKEETAKNTSLDITIQPEYDMVKDGDYFKTVNETGSPYRGRFRGLSYSRSVVEDEIDSSQDMSTDILGLDNYIVLDNMSDDDGDEDVVDGTLKNSQIDNTNETFNDGTILAVASNNLGQGSSVQKIVENKKSLEHSHTGDGSKILMENQTDNAENVKSESAQTPKISKTASDELKTETSTVMGVKRKASELSTHDVKEEPKNKERKLETIKKEDCCEENELKAATPCNVVTPLVHDIRIASPPPSQSCVTSDDHGVFEVIVEEPSIEVVDLTESSQVEDQPMKTSQEKVESDMIEKMKKCWNKGNLQDVVNVNSNLTSSRYMRRKYPKDQWSTLTSALEGSSRIPPLFRNEKTPSNSSLDAHGRSPLEIAREIGEQISNIEKDCARRIQMIETTKSARAHELTMLHRQQVNVLKHKQIVEMRNLMRFLSNRPYTAFSEMQENRLKNEHMNQGYDLRNLHGQQMRALHENLEGEQQKIQDESKIAKTNLQHMIDKLKATTNQIAVHPDHVHTTIDLLKGPCRSNGNTQKLVPVCLPADIASYMVREDKLYDMYYRYT